jgi:hypothetical protein
MRQERIVLTHELGRFQSRAIFSPDDFLSGRLRSLPLKIFGQS